MQHATDERILVAATSAFGARGYDGTSLDDLARDLGIRKQTILYWFPSKEALLAAGYYRTSARSLVVEDRAS
jgi:AcrR family transcriptional regulator